MTTRKKGAIVVEPDFVSSRARSIRLKEVSRIAGRANEVEAKIRRHGCLRRYIGDIVLLLGLLNDFIRGRYRKIPFRVIAAEHCAQRYLYKRFRDILSKEMGFHLDKNRDKKKQWSLYIRQADSLSIGSLASEDLDEIEWPLDLSDTGDKKDIKTKANLLHLAGWFWDEIVRLKVGGQPAWIPLRNLVECVERFISLSGTKTVSVEDKAMDEDAPTLESRDGTVQYNDAYFDPEAVKRWAESFANRLNDKQAQVFHFYYGEELTLAEIATWMDLSGASETLYHLERALGMLREFSQDQR